MKDEKKQKIEAVLEEIALKTRKGSIQVSNLGSKEKEDLLIKMSDFLYERRSIIIDANKKDLIAAHDEKLSAAMIDRLLLDEKRILMMSQAMKEIATLKDPVGEIESMKTMPNGMRLGRMKVPLGVIGIIYESRPNITSDLIALSIKSGNGLILKGGKEAFHSNQAIVDILAESIKSQGYDKDLVGFIPFTERYATEQLLKLDRYIDLLIPRGGYQLIRFVVENSTIPVVKHDQGICHVYIDQYADPKKSLDIVINAKVQRPGVCNAMESLLVNSRFEKNEFEKIIKTLHEKSVRIRACERTLKTFSEYDYIESANEDDWSTEYLDLILSVKMVDSINDAIEHIRKYGSAHTDVIVTENYSNAMQFIKQVDSSAVMVNVSSRLNDGGQFGLGAEVGISTQKLHCRGPMGIDDLTSKKWIVLGDGQIRS